MRYFASPTFYFYRGQVPVIYRLPRLSTCSTSDNHLTSSLAFLPYESSMKNTKTVSLYMFDVQLQRDSIIMFRKNH